MTTRRRDWELILLGLAVLALYLALAYWLVFRLAIFMPDALARASSALAVFFSAEPKFANIGFVWLPVPTLLQLPLILVPALRDQGFAANVVTAITGAGAALSLALILRHAKVHPIVRWLTILVFALNPMVLFYSINGMSEITFTLFVFLAALGYWRWRETGAWVNLTGAAVASGFALLTRYEAVFLIGVLILGVAITALARRPDNVQFSESAVLMYAAPPVYMGFLWVMANWIITGDPLFFARSPYSAAGYVTYYQIQDPWLLTLKGDIVATLQASLIELWRLFPAFLILSGGLIVAFILKAQWDSLVALALAWSPLALLVLNVYFGKVNLFTRYFFSAIPMSFLLAAGIILAFNRWRSALALVAAFVLGASAVNTVQAMRASPEWNYVHQHFLDGLLAGAADDTYEPELQMARYIHDQTQGTLLVDNFEGNRLILFSGQPARFITTSDSVFRSVVLEPFGAADYVLVLRPTQRFGQAGQVDLINQTYPDLYQFGGLWVELEQEIGDWRLYRVVGSPNQLPVAGSSN